MNATESSPTVVVSRRVRSGRERDARRWFRKITAAAAHADGYIAADVQPPAAEHPDEWVVVYQFESAAALDAWLDSPARSELVDASAELFEDAGRAQVLATATAAEPVTAVSSFDVLDGHADGFVQGYLELRRVLAAFEGYLRCELFEPVPGAQHETIIVFSFASRETLDAWLHSPERQASLARLDEHLAGGRTVNVVAGFGGWFAADGAAPVKRWKQAALVLLALFPTALAIGELRAAALPSVTGPLAIFIGNAIGVAVLSWLLMPMLTRRFADWLHR